MKSIFYISIFITFIGCSNRLEKDRILFTNTVIEHPNKLNIILDTSLFICKPIKSKNIVSSKIIDKMNYYKYKLYEERICYERTSDFDDNKYVLIKIDTVHEIVYKNVEPIHDFITFHFKFQKNQWCLDTVWNMNALNFHIDY